MESQLAEGTIGIRLSECRPADGNACDDIDINTGSLQHSGDPDSRLAVLGYCHRRLQDVPPRMGSGPVRDDFVDMKKHS